MSTSNSQDMSEQMSSQQQSKKKINLMNINPTDGQAGTDTTGQKISEREILRANRALYQDENKSDLIIDVEGDKSGLENQWKYYLGRIPNILLYLGFAGLAVFYAVSVTVAAPVLFAGGIILAAVFALRAVTEVWKMFAQKSVQVRKLKISKSKWFRPNFLEFLSSGVIGVGLLTLGILMLINPAFLGALLGVSLAVKIGLVVAGVAFVAKSVFDYFGPRMPKSKPMLKHILTKLNIPDTILYGAGLALGIMALIMNGAFAVAPVFFVAVFACRTIASFLRMFGNSRRCARIAKSLEVMSLFLIAGLLLGAGIMFAPAIATSLGVSALFVKIAGCVAGGLFALAAAAKIWVGTKIESQDLLISGVLPDKNKFMDSLEDNEELQPPEEEANETDKNKVKIV